MMDVTDYMLLKKGFFNKRIYESRILRRHVYLILSAWCEKLPSAYRIWPLPMDDELKDNIKNHVDKAALETLRIHREMKVSYEDGVNSQGKKIVITKYLN